MSHYTTIFLGFLGFILFTGSTQVEYLSRRRHTEYDYIVVGAGSAGSVLANRLSEDSQSTVLLVEAGGVPDEISEVPLFLAPLLHTDMDWQYYSEPQSDSCQGLDRKRAYYPRGKALGGTSSINAMLYVRGNRRDFDEWAKSGASGWSWRDVLYYFKKSEDQTNPKYLPNDFHSQGGYLTISSVNYETPLRKAYLEAVQSSGYKVSDINAEDQLGFMPVQATIRDGFRCSTEKAFLRPAAHRDNLDILLHAHVTRVQFDDEKRARWVIFEQDNATHSVSARKEIILSAGTFGSPQILMLSGVGPREHLQPLGIPVISDLPVGENLQDHLTTGGQIYLLNRPASIVNSRDINNQSIGALLAGKGPLTVPGYVEMLGFVNTDLQNQTQNWPDIQIFFVSSMNLPTTKGEAADVMDPYKEKDVTSLLPMILRPKSRGYLKLRSRDPHEHPIINPRYFSVREDLVRLVKGMKIAEEFIQSSALSKFNPIRIPEVVIGCEDLDTESEDYLTCLARTLTITTSHQCGTCKMGDPWDPTVVVDPELRVKGVKNLRVADASVMPTVTSGNINAPTIMIAEKAADMIRGRFWNSDSENVELRREKC